ncbi:hypothetical protein [Bradyrhizobium sp. CSA112]|uniref:hypothetical protein n=1 Tax=Bradyrhizobium sp. CSA112 TaxID=2699170 RepID=UPI0023AF547D|nr:hypothetical protein [Bradyrhizobium sp. CSA112]
MSQAEREELTTMLSGGKHAARKLKRAQATIRLSSVETGWIRKWTIVAHDLGAAIAALKCGESATYSVAWIDCLAGGARFGCSLGNVR